MDGPTSRHGCSWSPPTTRQSAAPSCAGERLPAAALKRLNEPRRNGHRTGGGFASSRNAFCLARRSSGHGIAVRYSYELDLAFPAGAIIDQNRGPVSHVQRLLFDDNLRRAHPARGKYGSQRNRSRDKRSHGPLRRSCPAQKHDIATVISNLQLPMRPRTGVSRLSLLSVTESVEFSPQGRIKPSGLNCLLLLWRWSSGCLQSVRCGVRIVSLSGSNRRSLVPEPRLEVDHERQYFQ